MENLAKALAKAQGEMGSAGRDRQNPHFKNRYATMESVVSAVRGPLSTHGIAWHQRVGVEGKVVSVETVLLCGADRLECGVLRAEARDPGPQGIGSVLTYLRRYSLMAACGIAPGDDDDGEAGERKPEPPPRASFDPEPTLAALRGKYPGVTLVDVEAFLENMKQPSLSALGEERRGKFVAAVLDNPEMAERFSVFLDNGGAR